MSTRARIATVCQGQRFFSAVEENRAYVLDLLDLALRVKPDLVCLPETFTTVVVPKAEADFYAESVPGPTTESVADLARRGRCYVLCPLLTLREGRVYNSAVLLDRSGEVAGIYDKRHPVTSVADYTVLENGVFPGDGSGVFDTDFGRIGARICFDAGFPEDWEEMQRQGVRLVCWPSAYDGGMPLTAYAALHRYYVVTSVRTERSRIIDPCGTLLAATDRLNNIIWRDINLDFAVCHYDFNFGIPDQILADYGERVALRSYAEGGLFLVEPTDPTVTVAKLKARYGFEDTALYHLRHRQAYADQAQGRSPTPQEAAHGMRPMYARAKPQ